LVLARVAPAVTYFFFCVNAEAAADLASFEAVLLLRTLAAELATLALVFSVLPFCVSAEAATAFSALVAVLLFITFAAADAAFVPVLPLLAIGKLSCSIWQAVMGSLPGPCFDPSAQ